MQNEYISREAAKAACGCEQATKYGNETPEQRSKSYSTLMLYEIADAIDDVPAADVAPVVRCRKDRLTKLGANGIYGLVKVKDNEQEVDSPYKNTLAAIVECFQRLAEYENAEFGTDGGEHHAD